MPPITDPAAPFRELMSALQASTRERLFDALVVVDADPDEAMGAAYGYLLDAASGQRTYAPHELAALARGVEQARAEYTRTLAIGRATTARVRELERVATIGQQSAQEAP